jgi:hypothetical protein
MAAHRTTVGRTALDSDRSLCIDAIGFIQGTDPKQRASVDVAAETTRFEVVLRDHATGRILDTLAGDDQVWLKKEEAKLYAQGFVMGRRDARVANG